MGFEWKKIGNNTYMAKIGICTIGMYMTAEKEAVLIDTGSKPSEPLLGYFEENNIRVGAVIQTHLHIDHFANTDTLCALWGCPVYAARGEISARHNALSLPLTAIASEGPLEIGGSIFETISTPGHSTDHISVTTPDNICFIGDVLMSERLAVHAKLPYMFRTAQAIESMKKINSLNFACHVLAHAGLVSGKEFPQLAKVNIKKEEELYDFLCSIAKERPRELFAFFNRFFELQDINITDPMMYTIHAECLYGKILDLCEAKRLKLEDGIVMLS